MDEPQTSQSRMRGRLTALAGVFRMLADGIFLTLLVLFGASAVLAEIHSFNRYAFPSPALDPRLLRDVHPHLDGAQIRRMLQETYFDEPFVYSSFTGFKERSRKGEFVSVSPQGFRYGSDPHQDVRAPGSRKVCLFGGSTMFGYGVDDRNTIAAHLQTLLNAHRPDARYSVFNFGRAAYYSAQESALFQELVRDGVRCDMALFLDGVNEHRLGPDFTHTQSVLYAAYNYSLPRFLLVGLQNATLVNDIASRIVKPPPVPEPSVAAIVRGYRAAVAIDTQLAAVTGTRVVFVVQPLPGYRNRFSDFAFQSGSCPPGPCRAFTRARISAMARLADGRKIHDLTGLFEHTRTLPFLDDVHYTPAANLKVAEAIEPLILQAE
jgi:hypothetical protein